MAGALVEHYSVVWWLNAQTEDGIIDGLLRLGTMFVQGLDQLADRRIAAERVINSVLGGFDKPVLLVFDNLEDEALMRTWLPRTGAQALATSRDTAWSTDIMAIPLQIWTLETAVEYLARASGRADLSDDDARAIAQAVGALPLALAHAAASLRSARMVSPQRYLERINEHLHNAPRGAEYPRSVFATFSTAIAQAEQQAPGAAAVLCFAASFAPDAIPDELFRQASEYYAEGLQPVLSDGVALDLRSAIADELRLDEALGALDRLSLLSFTQSSRTYSMHRLVQLAAQDLAGEDGAWRECAVSVADTALSGKRMMIATWPQCERLLPHARAALDALADDTVLVPAGRLASRCAGYLWQRGEYAAAEPWPNAGWQFKRRRSDRIIPTLPKPVQPRDRVLAAGSLYRGGVGSYASAGNWRTGTRPGSSRPRQDLERPRDVCAGRRRRLSHFMLARWRFGKRRSARMIPPLRSA